MGTFSYGMEKYLTSFIGTLKSKPVLDENNDVVAINYHDSCGDLCIIDDIIGDKIKLTLDYSFKQIFEGNNFNLEKIREDINDCFYKQYEFTLLDNKHPWVLTYGLSLKTTIIKFFYDEKNSLFKVEYKNHKWGFLKSDLEWLVYPQFEVLTSFNDVGLPRGIKNMESYIIKLDGTIEHEY